MTLRTASKTFEWAVIALTCLWIALMLTCCESLPEGMEVGVNFNIDFNEKTVQELGDIISDWHEERNEQERWERMRKDMNERELREYFRDLLTDDDFTDFLSERVDA
jgi:hypothetical protein